MSKMWKRIGGGVLVIAVLSAIMGVATIGGDANQIGRVAAHNGFDEAVEHCADPSDPTGVWHKHTTDEDGNSRTISVARGTENDVADGDPRDCPSDPTAPKATEADGLRNDIKLITDALEDIDDLRTLKAVAEALRNAAAADAD